MIKQKWQQPSPDDLPQTFRDAVKIRGNLGIEYIWIDSLCVVQDSLEDWRAGAARVRDAYSNARMTIAAFAVEHSGQGLFPAGPRRETHLVSHQQTRT